MRLQFRSLFALALIASLGSAPVEGTRVRLVEVAGGFAAPVMVVEPPDETGRLFVVDQPGQIRVVTETGTLQGESFLDISDRIVELDPGYDEAGLLGLAFHPGYAENGRFYVYYSAPLRDGAPDDWDHTSHIAEFTVGDDPDLADPDSHRVVLQVDQPYGNHNGGQIGFGPDGMLYIPLGDGGNGGDQDAEGDDRGRPADGNGQTASTLLGSVLRIDVDGGDPYGIPHDNPLLDTEAAPETFAYGFRNPYGMSFDLDTGDMYVADAGQAIYEEVSRVEPRGNHGWNIREGTHCFNPDDFVNPPAECPDEGPEGRPLIDPVIEYKRGPDEGSVVVPGVMVRNAGLPDLDGRFLFGDYGAIRFLPTGVLYAATPTGDDLWPIERISIVPSGQTGTDLGRFLLGVYQDRDGEVYALTTELGGPAGDTGQVFRVEQENPPITRSLLPIIAAVAGGGVLFGGLATFALRRRADRDTP